MKRFAIMAVLGALMCGSLMAGCGGSSDDEGSVSVTNSANGTSTTTVDNGAGEE